MWNNKKTQQNSCFPYNVILLTYYFTGRFTDNGISWGDWLCDI